MNRIECFGGPRDGQTVTKRGFMFADIGTVKDGAPATVQQSGVYTRTPKGYEWRPD